MTDVTVVNPINNRICCFCFNEVRSCPDLNVSTGSESSSSPDFSPSSTSNYATNNVSTVSVSSQTMTEDYFQAVVKTDDNPDNASHI